MNRPLHSPASAGSRAIHDRRLGPSGRCPPHARPDGRAVTQGGKHETDLELRTAQPQRLRIIGFVQPRLEGAGPHRAAFARAAERAGVPGEYQPRAGAADGNEAGPLGAGALAAGGVIKRGRAVAFFPAVVPGVEPVALAVLLLRAAAEFFGQASSLSCGGFRFGADFRRWLGGDFRGQAGAVEGFAQRAGFFDFGFLRYRFGFPYALCGAGEGAGQDFLVRLFCDGSARRPGLSLDHAFRLRRGEDWTFFLRRAACAATRGLLEVPPPPGAFAGWE